MHRYSCGAQSKAKAGEITGGGVPSAVTGGARSTSRNFSEKRIADESENVKSPTLDDEIRRQIMSEENKATALLRDVGKQYPEPVAYAADLTDAILSQSQGDVKYSVFNEEVTRQLLDNSDILYVDPNKKNR